MHLTCICIPLCLLPFCYCITSVPIQQTMVVDLHESVTIQWIRSGLGLTKTQRRRFRPSMWPPERSNELHLERCIRCLPFLANTGGFFVALLRKDKPWPKAEATPKQTTLTQLQISHQFSQCVPPEVAKDVGIPSSSLETGSLMRRGARKLFYCTSRLVSTLREPRDKPLSLISAGVCAFRLKRSLHSSMWHLTLPGMDALKLKRGERLKETNAAAAKKSLEGHTCAACGEHRHGSFFSRKMLTRPPSKRKCSDCVAQGSVEKEWRESQAHIAHDLCKSSWTWIWLGILFGRGDIRIQGIEISGTLIQSARSSSHRLGAPFVGRLQSSLNWLESVPHVNWTT